MQQDEAIETLKKLTTKYEKLFRIRKKSKMYKRMLDFLENVAADISDQKESLEKITNELLSREEIIILDTSILIPQFLSPLKDYNLIDVLYATEISGIKSMKEANEGLFDSMSEYVDLVCKVLGSKKVTTTHDVFGEFRCGYERAHLIKMNEERGSNIKRRTTVSLEKIEERIYYALIDKKSNDGLVLPRVTPHIRKIMEDMDKGYISADIRAERKLESISDTDKGLILAGFYLAGKGIPTSIISNDLPLISNAKRLAIAYYMRCLHAYDVRGRVGDIENKEKMRNNETKIQAHAI